MSRYQAMFANCREQNRIAFIPFVMLGDPNYEQSLAIIEQLVNSGADGLELGMPFSDPVADGPVIQEAAIRALDNHFNLHDGFKLLTEVRQRFPDIPIGLLVYANLVYHRGVDHFYKACKNAGVDSVLVADVPLRETERFDSAAISQGVDPVHILPPNATDEQLAAVSAKSRGYTYVLGRAGVTGTDQSATLPSARVMQALVDHQAAPPVMGFGISKPDQVAAARDHGFAGAISGSATVKVIAENLGSPESCLAHLDAFVTSMHAATVFDQDSATATAV